MEVLLEQSRALVTRVSTDFIRDLTQRIDWNSRMIVIRGQRGVGKTTMLLQHIKLNFGVSSAAMYITLDDLFFTENRLTEIARWLVQKGGKVLYIDEVHRYPHTTWALEIKNIYDLLPDLKIVMTGSSIMEIEHHQADLSRRAVFYELSGLTYREHLIMTTGQRLPAFALDDILIQPHLAAETIIRDHHLHPLAMLDQYMQSGYYPFFSESLPTYTIRLREVIRTVLESDLHVVPEHTITDYSNLGRLLYVIAGVAPFKPNISKLSERIGLNRNRLVQYIYLLERARLLNLLHSDSAGISALQKPAKIFLENTNLMYALSPGGVNKGSERETFVLSHLRNWIQSSLTESVSVLYPQHGDFLLDGLRKESWLLEVGGAGKSKAQLKSASRGVIVRDNVEFGGDGIVPLWLFGFIA